LPVSNRPIRKRRRWLWLAVPAALLLTLLLINLFLQNVWAHRHPYFVPDYEQSDLSPILAQAEFSDQDYRMIFQQTGLAAPAVDSLLNYGEWGIQRILETQTMFFKPHTPQCLTLIGGRFTCEDRLKNENGDAELSVPLAPLEPGDVIVSFSTHTFGWRHGHAGLVVDAQEQITLEAVMMFSDSAQNHAWHWETYSNFMVLRVRDADDATRQAVAQFALKHLDGIPYHLTSGIFGSKAPDPEASSLAAQCAYLPWYAWQAFGYDLDSDGGKIVTVLDLAESPLFEVVQVYGIDPLAFLN